MERNTIRESMSEFKGTKGEWKVYPCGVNETRNIKVKEPVLIGVGVQDNTADEGNMLVCICGNEDLKEVQFNAKLIAAAPDLLESLHNCLSTLKALAGHEAANDWCEVQQAESAIKKATEL